MLQNLRNRNYNKAVEKAYNALHRPYLNFTTSYLASVEQRERDLRQLVSHPRIASITFGRGATDNWTFDYDASLEHNVDWMFIGTTHVTIPHAGALYAIGEFVIYITRYNSEGDLCPGVLVENVTPLDSPVGGLRADRHQDGQDLLYAHPHCFGEIATFCMTDGKQEIINALIEGNILETFDYVDNALRSYGPDKPFCHISNWPTI